MPPKTPPSEILPKYTLPRHQRYRIIAEGIISGLNFSQIARQCGVSERTIYTDRRSIDYQTLANLIFDDYMIKLKSLLKIGIDTGDKNDIKFVIRELGLTSRQMMPRRIEAKAEIRQVVIKPTFNKLLEADYKVLEDESDTG